MLSYFEYFLATLNSSYFKGKTQKGIIFEKVFYEKPFKYKNVLIIDEQSSETYLDRG